MNVAINTEQPSSSRKEWSLPLNHCLSVRHLWALTQPMAATQATVPDSATGTQAAQSMDLVPHRLIWPSTVL